MKTLTLCGSMRFAAEMQAIAYELEALQGCNVLPCITPPPGVVPDPAALARLAAAHRRKIELSDGVYVVNPDGYVGDAVRSEIAYARSLGKEIRYLCPPPCGSNCDTED